MDAVSQKLEGDHWREFLASESRDLLVNVSTRGRSIVNERMINSL